MKFFFDVKGIGDYTKVLWLSLEEIQSLFVELSASQSILNSSKRLGLIKTYATESMVEPTWGKMKRGSWI